MSIITIVALLVFVTIPEGESNLSMTYLLTLCCQPPCTLWFVSSACLRSTFSIQQYGFRCFYPSLTSHKLRYQSGESRSESAMSMHHQGEKTHWTLHRHGRGEPCKLPLHRHWDYVSILLSLVSYYDLWEILHCLISLTYLWSCSATLKKNGKKICLDPEAPWVKKVLEKKQVL